jgi:hypothetical protein
MVTRRLHAGVDRVEDATDQEWAPGDLRVELLRHSGQVVKGQVGPRAGAIEEAFYFGRHVASGAVCVLLRETRVYGAAVLP